MTNYKNVPVLRFKEFEGEDWEVKRLKDIGKIIGGGTPSTSISEYWNGDISWFTPTEIKQKYITKSLRTITQKGLVKSSAKVLPVGTILFSSRATIGDIGISLIECTTNQGFQSFVIDKKITINEFMYYWIIENKKEFMRRANGSTFLEISKSEIEKIKIILPSLPEQQKIANFLTATDTKIQQLRQKKELLNDYKKGVMQQIFKQEIRFKNDDGGDFEDWEVKKLGEVASITTGRSNREDSGLTGQYAFFDRSQDIRTSDIYLFDGEAIIVAGEGQDFIPKYFMGKFDLHQRTYAIMDFKNVNGKYLFFFINFHRRYFLQQAVGSTVKSLRLPMFKKMLISIPTLPEQQKIANFLSSIDERIASVSEQVETVERYKKGLLQGMFV
jgi:type I restriction enzyme S subunit